MRLVKQPFDSIETNNFNNRNSDKDHIFDDNDINKRKIINNYVHITNIININENFNQDIMQPKIEMETKTFIKKKTSVINGFGRESNIY